jgi:hypothetical protein
MFPAALKLNWVGDGSTAFSGRHELTNSLTLDAVAGGVTSSSSSSSKLRAQLAHGALMLLAFAVFMPTGALMARHKWMMGDAAVRGVWCVCAGGGACGLFGGGRDCDSVSMGICVKSKLRAQLAHGALMLLAFAVFMPTEALMARHKWIMGDAAVRRGWAGGGGGLSKAGDREGAV